MLLFSCGKRGYADGLWRGIGWQENKTSVRALFEQAPGKFGTVDEDCGGEDIGINTAWGYCGHLF